MFDPNKPFTVESAPAAKTETGFDPSKPFEVESAGPPAFDPSMPFEIEGQAQLTNRYQDPIVKGPVQAPTAELGRIAENSLWSAIADAGYQYSGDILSSLANAADRVEDFGQGISYRLFGPNETPSEPTLVAEDNFVSRFLRERAEEDYLGARLFRGKAAQVPVDQEKLITFDSVVEDPLDWRNTGRFAAETVAGTLPQTAAVVGAHLINPYLGYGMGTSLAHSSISQGMAEQRTGDSRNVTTSDLGQALPYSAASGLLDAVGAAKMLTPVTPLARGVGQSMKRVGKSAITEGATEAVQESIELTGEKSQNLSDLSAGEYVERGITGAIGGTTTGSGIRAGGEAYDAAKQGAKKLFRGPETEAQMHARIEAELRSDPEAYKQEMASIRAEAEAIGNDTAEGVIKAIDKFADVPVEEISEVFQLSRLRQMLDHSVRADKGKAGELEPVPAKPIKKYTDAFPDQSGFEKRAAKSLPKGADNIVTRQLNRLREMMAERGFDDPGAINAGNASRDVLKLKDRYSAIGGSYGRWRNHVAGLATNTKTYTIEKTEQARQQLLNELDEDLRLELPVHDIPDNPRLHAGADAPVGAGDSRTARAGAPVPAEPATSAAGSAPAVSGPVEQPSVVKPDSTPETYVGRDKKTREVGKPYVIKDGDKKYREDGKVREIRTRDGQNYYLVREEGSGSGIPHGSWLAYPLTKTWRKMGAGPTKKWFKQNGVPRFDDGDAFFIAGYDLADAIKRLNDMAENKLYKQEQKAQAKKKAPKKPASKEAEDGDKKPSASMDDAASASPSMDEAVSADSNSTDDGGDRVPVRKSGVGGMDAGTNQFGFNYQMKARLPSIRRGIWQDAGHNPDKAVNFSPKRQLRIAKKALKDKFGIEVAGIDPKLNINDAIDQIADLYHNMSTMAFVLGLHEKAMALPTSNEKGSGSENKPSLRLILINKGRGFLGRYLGGPDNHDITLIRRSNSFAHEWGHALDSAMMFELDGPSEFHMLSRKIREEGIDVYDPQSAKAAYVKLIQSLFFEMDGLAARIVELNAKLERARSEKSKAKIKKELEELKRGNSANRKEHTEYYKRAAKMRPKDYWKDPAEMLARSFEAYIAYRVEQAGGDTTALSKTDAGYMSSADERFTKTFPRLEDRVQIFQAYDQLFTNMGMQSILNPDRSPIATLPDTSQDFVLTQITREAREAEDARTKGLMGKVRREASDIKKAMMGKANEKMRPDNPRSIKRRLRDGYGYALTSMQEMFRVMEARYKSPIINQIANLVVKRPGSGQASGYIDEHGRNWGTYDEELTLQNRYYQNKIMDILEVNNLNQEDTSVMDDFYDALTDESFDGDPAIVRAAAQARLLLKTLHNHATEAGIELGYVKDGAYLNRVMDAPVVATDEVNFKTAAAEVYGIMFEREIGQKGSVNIELIEDLFDEIDYIWSRVSASDDHIKKWSASKNGKVKQFRKLKREYDALIADKKKAKAKEKMQEIQDLIEEIYDDLKDDFSVGKAALWFRGITQPNIEASDNMPPRSSYMKKRSMPPEADQIMKEWRIKNPVHLLHKYSDDLIRDAAIKRREATLKKLYKKLANVGMDPDDMKMLQRMVNTAMGKITTEYTPLDRAATNVRAYGTLYLLPRAVLASLSEPITVGVRTARFDLALRSLAETMLSIVHETDSMKDRAEFARAAGLMSDVMLEQALMARMSGGDFDMKVRTQKALHNMFTNTFLTGLTRRQHMAAMKAGDLYMRSLAHKLIANEGKPSSKLYAGELRELGVHAGHEIEFAKWLVGQEDLMTLERVDELRNTPNGQSYLIGLERVRSESIQMAYGVERPEWAHTPTGKMVLGITSFMFSYFENIVKATPKRMYRGFKDGGMGAGTARLGGYASSLAMLWLGHSVVQLIRTAIFNSDRLEEWIEEGDLVENVMMAGASQMGIAGPVGDTVFNAYEGVKYQRDLANMMVGPHLGSFLQMMQGILSGSQSNSPKSNTTEHAVIRNAYGVVVAPMLSYGLNTLPAGRITGKALGAATMYFTSGSAREDFADMIIGERKSKTKENWERGK